MKFSELKLHPALQANLDKIQFLECTPIQDQAIPLLRKGKDLSGLAQTGTGKTGAFLIPLIDRILKAIKPDDSVADSETVAFPEWKKKQYILVLVPTRELCEQVQDTAKKFIEGTGLSAVSIYGGTTYEKQIAGLKQGVELVIATPGRFIDLFKEHVADLGLVRAVVFDEADRMFDMGFKDDMKFILRRLPKDRQFLVFSATLNFEVLNVAYEFGADPMEINISRDQAKAENVKDSIVHLGQEDKPKYLLSLLKKLEPRQAIIFSNYKHNVERIAKFLTSNGVPAMGISSLLTQAQRNRVMEQFRADNEKNILVATDVAARGLDILGVDLVLNFDLPEDAENYVHRIGRTGRAGATGQAYSLVSDRDVDSLQRIEEYLGNKVEVYWPEESEIVGEYQPFPRDESRGPMGRGPRGPRPEGGRGGGGGGRFEKRGERPRGPRRDHDRGPRQGEGGERRPHSAGGAGGGGGPRREHPSRGGGQQEHRRGPGQGPGREHHRDRASGRHRGGGAGGESRAQGGQGQHPQGGGPRRDHRGGRPQHSGGGHGQRHDRHRGGAPRHGGGQRPAAMSAAGSKAGLGQKVSGFLKKLFGKES